MLNFGKGGSQTGKWKLQTR